MVEQAREGDDADLVRRHGRSLLVGGTHFLNYMAAKYGDGRAAWLQLRHLDMPEFKFGHGTQENGYYHGLLWGFLTYAPAVEPVAPPRRGTMLRRFEDSGVVHYRVDAHKLVVIWERVGYYSSHDGKTSIYLAKVAGLRAAQ